MTDDACLRVSVCLLVAGLSSTGPSSAVEWRVEKGFGLSTLYSDNADTSDGEARGESVISFSPFVVLEGDGRRLDFSLSSELELQRFVDENRVEVDPRIVLSSRTTLVERLVDIYASARVSRRSVGNDPLVGEELTRFDETEDVYEINVGPTFANTLGKRARYKTGYRFAAARSSGDAIVGSDLHSVSAEVSGDFGDAIVSIGGNYELARFESDEQVRSGRIGIDGSYRFQRTLLGFVAAGYDQVNTGDARVIDGEFWSFDLRWRPSPRLLVRAGYGERAYGRQPSASIVLTGRRSTIEFAWSRDLAFVTGSDSGTLPSALASEADGTVDADGVDTGVSADVSLEGGLDVGSENGESLAPLGRDAGSVDETVGLTYRHGGRRSTLSASLGWVQRERLDDTGFTTSGLKYGLGLRRLLSRRIEANADWTAIENDFSDERKRSRENRFRLSIRVEL